MKTSTIVILAVVGVAVVGGGVLLLRRRAATPTKKGNSTADNVATTISALIPAAVNIAQAWMDRDEDEDD